MKGFLKYATFICSLFILLLINSNVNAATESFYSRAVRDSNGNVRFKWSLMEKSGVNATKIMKWSNSDPVYCIQPGLDYLDFSEGSYNYTDNENSIISLSKLTKDVIRKLKLLSYYGYGYGNHTDDSWYLSTQLEIWNTISPGCCYITLGDIALIESQRKEINDLVNSVITVPSLQNRIFTQVVGSEVEYIDTNNVLSNYTITGCTNCSARISGNKLIVKSNSVGSAKVNLKRTITNAYSPSVIFYNGEYQALMSFGSPDPMTTDVTLDVIGGTIKVQKVDKDTNTNIAQGDASLEGAVYTVYNSNKEKIGTITTNSSGYGELLVGTGIFYVKETTSSDGYLLDPTEHKVILSSDITEETIISKEQIIKGHALITKLYGDDEIGFLKEAGAEFEIIDSNNNVVSKLISDNDGVSLVELPFGEYTIKQTKGKENFSIAEDIKFSITENNKIYKFEIKNLSYPRLQITKKDVSTDEVLPGATIEIHKYNEETEEYEFYYKGVSDSEGKIYLDTIEKGKYMYFEVEAPENFVLDEENYYFEIEEYGKTYYEELTNIRYSTLEITKKDVQTEEGLAGATIEIHKYNEETEEYEFYYKGLSDSEGKIYLDTIEKGKYMYFETEAPENFVLTEEKYYFEVEEDGLTYHQELTNERIIEEVPDTLTKQPYRVYIISLTIALIGVCILLYGNQKKR